MFVSKFPITGRVFANRRVGKTRAEPLVTSTILRVCILPVQRVKRFVNCVWTQTIETGVNTIVCHNMTHTHTHVRTHTQHTQTHMYYPLTHMYTHTYCTHRDRGREKYTCTVYAVRTYTTHLPPHTHTLHTPTHLLT